MSERGQSMGTSLKAELKIIPPVAWAIAGIAVLLWFTVAIPLLVSTHQAKPAEKQDMPVAALIGLLVFAGLLMGAWVSLIGYVNADAGRRNMSRTLWTLLVIFVPNALGFILYFLLRRPVALPCPKCGIRLQQEFVFCPACGHEIAPKCPSCRRAVETGWANCAYCGTGLG